MKYFFLICLALAMVTSVDASEDSVFIGQVNTLWRENSHDEIFQLATTEAAKQPPPPEAYAVLFGYYLFIKSNHEQAIQSLDSLLERLENTDPEGFQAVTAFKAEILQAGKDEMKPPTQAELNTLHQMFPDDFPINTLLLSISRKN